MGCGPCGTQSAITDSSQALLQQYVGNRKLAPKLTGLLRALDQVEIRQRTEAVKISWKPSMFEERIQPYGRKPEGTDVIFKHAPLYFTDNAAFTYDYTPASPEGGICEGSTLCSEPPANQIPGDSFQTFTYRFEGTAWETPQVCLKDLLHYENGSEYLRNFLTRVERTPFEFYDMYIRNRIWDDGEKYLLANTGISLLWNTPERVSAREVPNLLDFQNNHPSAGAAVVGAPNMVAIAHLQHELETMMEGATTLNVDGKPDMMLVADRSDMFNIFYHDDTCGPCSFVEGGMGFSPFSLSIVDKLPFAYKEEKFWFRCDVDPVTNEFYRVAEKGYIVQNGGEDLRHTTEWKNAQYGVMTFMTSRPYIYRRFGDLPNMPTQVPQESLRYLSPRFQFAPLMEKCSYTRGIVAWRGEDEFSFQRTGEKIIHVIFERDKFAGSIRSVAADECPTAPATCEVDIPVTCKGPSLTDCCVTAGAAPYEDTSYTVFYDGDIIAELGVDPNALPAAAQFQTIKGIFDVSIVATNSDGTIVTIGVDAAQHTGGHFCCTDQMIGFVTSTPDAVCEAVLEGGLCPDPFDPTKLLGKLSTASFAASAAEDVTVMLDRGCGTPEYVTMTLDAIDGDRVTLSFTTTDYPDGFPCEDAKTICASDVVGCECIPPAPDACVPDAVEPLPLSKDAVDGEASGDAEVKAETEE